MPFDFMLIKSHQHIMVSKLKTTILPSFSITLTNQMKLVALALLKLRGKNIGKI